MKQSCLESEKQHTGGGDLSGWGECIGVHTLLGQGPLHQAPPGRHVDIDLLGSKNVLPWKREIRLLIPHTRNTSPQFHHFFVKPKSSLPLCLGNIFLCLCSLGLLDKEGFKNVIWNDNVQTCIWDGTRTCRIWQNISAGVVCPCGLPQQTGFPVVPGGWPFRGAGCPGSLPAAGTW